MFRALHQRQSLVSFIVTVGLVDAAIGGFGAYGSLLILGVGTVGLGVILHGWLIYHQRLRQRHHATVVATPVATPCLPPQASQPRLPILQKKRQPLNFE